MTTPPATPPPWRPKGYDDDSLGDDPTLSMPLPDATTVQPVPQYPPPQYPPPAPGYGYPPVSPPPWPVVGQRRRYGWIVGLLACGGLLAGALVAALVFQPQLPSALRPATTQVTTTLPPTTVPTTEAPPVGASLDSPAPVGTDVIPAKGWTVRVNKVDLNADAEIARSAFWLRPGRGKRYVLVTLDVTHDAPSSSALFAEMKFALVTPNGSTHGPTLNPSRDTFDIAEQLPPQGAATGSMNFEVPRDQIEGSVLRVEPMFTLDGQKDQRFLALT